VNIVCVGDCGVDRYLSESSDRPGGITLNFAAHARRLFGSEHRVVVVSALGNDQESNVVRMGAAAARVEAHFTELEGSTSIQYIDLEPSGEKVFVRYEQGVLGEYRVGAREKALIGCADLLAAPHYQQIDAFFDSVMESPSRGLRAVDFADFADHPSTSTVRHYVSRFDVAFFGLGPGDARLIDELDTIARAEEKLFVVTLGAAGSVALAPSGRVACDAVAVPRVVDTTGAGDTFAAGFLFEYVGSRDITAGLRRGAREAAVTIQRVGAF
jgi:sugar/nucleoside kinase (ribokinase family)